LSYLASDIDGNIFPSSVSCAERVVVVVVVVVVGPEMESESELLFDKTILFFHE